MKDMPIGKLMEAVKKAPAIIRQEVEIDEGKLWTFGDSAFVHMLPMGAEWSEYVENQKLANAIRERCAGMTLHTTIAGNPCIVSMPDPGGQTRIRGRVWRWEYSIGGFLALIRADGEPMSLSAYPGERHPLWRAVRRWERKNRKR